MYRFFDDLEKLGPLWKEPSHIFMSYHFLSSFYYYNKDVKHIFIEKDQSKIYGHLFSISFEKSSNYLNNIFLRLIMKLFFSFIKVKTLFLTNSFFTNVDG